MHASAKCNATLAVCKVGGNRAGRIHYWRMVDIFVGALPLQVAMNGVGGDGRPLVQHHPCPTTQPCLALPIPARPTCASPMSLT